VKRKERVSSVVLCGLYREKPDRQGEGILGRAALIPLLVGIAGKSISKHDPARPVGGIFSANCRIGSFPGKAPLEGLKGTSWGPS